MKRTTHTTTGNDISRRNFLRLSGLTGAALTIGYCLPAAGKGIARLVTQTEADSLGMALTSWISIDTTGKVTLLSHRSEMGQGAWQAIPQMIAEELEVDLNQVNIAFAPGHQSKFGSQVTGGSSTVRGSYKRLLRSGATAREMLVTTAAKRWNASKSDCYAQNGQVIHRPSGKKTGYGELVEEASKTTPPETVILKLRKDYTLIGKPLLRQDIPLKVNGKAIFGLDMKLPGMQYAVVERNPRFRGKVKSFDDSAAKAITGVKQVIKVQMNVFDHQLEGVAVVADSIWAAMQGRKALKVEWDDTGFAHHSTEQLYARMREDLTKDMLSYKTKGNFADAYNNAAQKLEAVYETPYQSHSCMEPLNCIAHYHDDTCEIWGPIQGPDWVQKDVAPLLGLKPENVQVNMTFLGGGFGRKAFLDYPHEAAVLSKAIGAPVQVVWTREDDMTLGPFRPGMVYQCKAGLHKDGRIGAFETRMAGQDMDHAWAGANKKNYNSSVTEGLPEPYFDSIHDYSFGDIPLESPIPVMWWRSVYASTNAFAYESFIDELAHAANMDPLGFRSYHLRDERYQAVINKLQDLTGWNTRGKNQGWGVALTECFKSIVAEAVKVSRKPDGKLKIDKVIAVMDCGWYVNPDTIRAQVEGSIVMALGAAITHETHFADGKAVERNFDTYKMPRISDMPDIEVHIMENDEAPGGVGEPGLPPLAPALCNAIFDLSGKRVRKLPFNLNDV